MIIMLRQCHSNLKLYYITQTCGPDLVIALAVRALAVIALVVRALAVIALAVIALYVVMALVDTLFYVED
jgi:hypothetical protein